MKDTKVQKELERAYIFSSTDILGRILLVNRDELLRYTNGPEGENETSLPINTDDNAIIEFSAPHDLISYASFSKYLATIYTNEWKLARLNKVITGIGEGVTKSQNMAKQAVSLLLNGRKDEANRFLQQAIDNSPNEPKVLQVTYMLDLLLGNKGAPLPEFEKITPSPSMTKDQIVELQKRIADVKKSIESKALRDALDRFYLIPDHLWQRGGPQMLLLKGYLHYSNADPKDKTECEEAIDVLSKLIQNHESYVSNHPESYFYLALCHDNALNFDKAVKNIHTYTKMILQKEELETIAKEQASANLEATIKGLLGTASIKLPKDMKDWPTSDKHGETKKDFW